ncbi:hypothetical protein H1O16_gp298 [Burkholderia phage BcepSaruman]|uniref:Uncharacterized protein n=1 Tax=Burkholderia phage BcepSaruman TaxID=2530032 RepID=A0A4D5ZD03_9CAUD|nr:hypothetical protein H1O16_gp298 [Burkholderia phage BcepSaruman]QBX06711.1 hypothetical protein BcepSaruman_298 [Burkholderia phage BcepSaruman]
MASYIRLYLVPVNGVQQVIDVDATLLIRNGGKFEPPQIASAIDLVKVPSTNTFTPFVPGAVDVSLTTPNVWNVRVCWREPVGTDDNPSTEIVTTTDPSGGECVCGITCDGVAITYVPVINVY